MKININGTKKDILGSSSLKDVVEEFCSNSKHVIAELNGSIIKSNEWKKSSLKENDTLELVSFVGGG